MAETTKGRSRRRYLLFAAMTVVLTLALSAASLLAVDVYLHHKYQRDGGVNVWGYRGPTIGGKAPGEIRIAVFGGSTAFGYGPSWDQSFPYLLEQALNHAGGPKFTVVNLAYNNECAYSFQFTMEDYEYLDWDVALLYEGYNDLAERPRFQVFRRESPVFRLTGYLPVFPIIFKEKAWAMMYGGDITQGYRGEGQTVFRPGAATTATAKVLEAAAFTAQSLEQQLGRLTRDTSDAQVVTPTEGCKDRWKHYCGAMFDAVTWARSRGKAVMVGTQPYISDLHVDQQNALAGMLRDRFGSDPAVLPVNLGRTVDLTNREIAYDGMHLTGPGNKMIADAIVPYVSRILAVKASW